MFTINAALLDACVLAVLQKADTCGYELTQNVKAVMDVSESTLYPVLRRLQKDKLLQTYDEEVNGRNRRYYGVTKAGLKQLEVYKELWQDYKKNIDNILIGEKKDDKK